LFCLLRVFGFTCYIDTGQWILKAFRRKMVENSIDQMVEKPEERGILH